VEYLAKQFSYCFSLEKPQPLKLGIHRDLAVSNVEPTVLTALEIKRALTRYCGRPRYWKSLREGAVRIDLHGQPAGVVTAAEAEQARYQLAVWNARKAGLPPPDKATFKLSSSGTHPDLLPNDSPLPKEHLVPGRLDLTVKFSELPQPLTVQSGIKIGIETGEGVVTAILPTKVWRKLEQAAKDYPRWVAALSGALEQFKDGEIKLKHPALQIFEKKPKPPVDSRALITEAPVSPAVPTPAPSSVAAVAVTPTAPVEAGQPPTAVRDTLRLKGKRQTAD
jgi:hypothetical protein